VQILLPDVPVGNRGSSFRLPQQVTRGWCKRMTLGVNAGLYSFSAQKQLMAVGADVQVKTMTFTGLLPKASFCIS
jgi:hypothetical protein